MPKSPLAPDLPLPSFQVAGVQWASLAAGLRYKNRDDLALIAFPEGATIAGVFTKSATSGHPVHWCRNILPRGTARAILANAGNANVFRGAEGDEAVRRSAEALAQELKCEPQDIYIASTGVIGERLPVETLCRSLPALAANLSPDAMPQAASAIMTTDTFAKWSAKQTTIAGTPVHVAGIAKGSGMIAPDMATMLAFVVTDAAIDAKTLQTLTREAADLSFNAITVDSDTSTSDTLLVCATGAAPTKTITTLEDPTLHEFRSALNELMQELAQMVIRDGEGAEKLIEIAVTGAKDDHSARTIAKAVANSPLVKTAIAGEDANWGRIVMAIGKAEQPIRLERIGISFGGFAVAANGQAMIDLDEAPIAAHLKGREIKIAIDVGVADGEARVWTCDLTHGYIDINADYRS